MNEKRLGNQRLKKWMKNHPRHNRIYAVFCDHAGRDIDCRKHDTRRQQIWIGHPDKEGGWIYGANILRVMGGATKTTQSWARPTKRYEDITEWFWPQFEKKGICMLTDYRHDWIAINKKSRKCSRCDAHQSRTVETRIERSRIEVWA